jgi:hypothetical protein
MCVQAMLLRSARTAFRAAPTAMRSGAARRTMCTAVAEAEAAAPVSPFSPSKPHNAMFYTVAGVIYVFTFKWQAADRALARDIEAHKAAHAPAETASEPAVAEAAAAPVAAAAPSAVVQAVVAAAPSTAAPITWKTSDVCGWLEAIELGEHAAAFKAHSVNGKMLLALSEQDLYATLNVVSPLHRKKIMMEIGALRKATLG